MTDAYEYAAKKAVEHFEKTPSWMVPAWNFLEIIRKKRTKEVEQELVLSILIISHLQFWWFYTLTSMALMTNSTLMLDLATHQTRITLATQLFAGFSLFSLDVFCYFFFFFLNRLCKSRCKRATDRKRLAFSESPFRHRGFLSVRSCYSRPKCILLCSWGCWPNFGFNQSTFGDTSNPVKICWHFL
jgi:hypothetical protein